MALTQLYLESIITANTAAKECFDIIHERNASELALEISELKGYLNYGALAYRVRVRSFGKKPYLIDLTTYDPSREQFLKNWALSVAESYYKNISEKTLRSRFGHGRKFIEWSEANNHSNLFESCEALHDSLIDYSRYLKVGISNIHRSGANASLKSAMSLCEMAFPNAHYNFYIGIEHVPYSNGLQVAVEVPSEFELTSFIKPLSDIFINICKYLDTDRRLPYSFLAGDDTVWMLPDVRPLICETVLMQPLNDYGTRLWRGLKNEIEFLMKASGQDFHCSVVESMGALDRRRFIVHSWPYSPDSRLHRIHIPIETSDEYIHKICRIAHLCFWHLFVLATSGNQQSVQDLLWNRFSAVERGGQNQRVIKNRAHKEVAIAFEAKFAKEFNLYLRVRAILVGDYNYEYLFGAFVYGEPPRRIYDDYPGRQLEQIKSYIVPTLNAMGLRRLRAYGLNFKSNNADILVSSRAGGHSVQTSMQSYSSGNMELNIEEATIFFTAVGSRAREVIAQSTSFSAGGCRTGAINAVALEDPHGLEPDCKNFLGCLFCVHYLIHINEVDVKKLWSMVYVIEQLQTIQSSEEEFNEVWGPTLARLLFLLDKITGIGEEAAQLVRIVEKQVYEDEDLNPYWQRKLDILVMSGYLS